MDVGSKVACLRIDGLILLFDSNAEARTVHLLTSWLTCLAVGSMLSERFVAFPFAEASEDPPRKALQRYSGAFPVCFLAFSIASSATWFTIQSKFACPTELTSASGAGFIKSIAYGIP